MRTIWSPGLTAAGAKPKNPSRVHTSLLFLYKDPAFMGLFFKQDVIVVDNTVKYQVLEGISTANFASQTAKPKTKSTPKFLNSSNFFKRRVCEKFQRHR